MINPKDIVPIAKTLIKNGETVAVAESVTAGLIMANFSLAKNATLFFQGGVTAYNLGQKTRQLNVDPVHAEMVNSVSEQVAQQMASAVAEKFCSQWGISITGYAVPVPALKIRSCFAFYAFTYKGQPVFTGRIDAAKRGQAKVQMHFAESVITAFAQHISQMH